MFKQQSPTVTKQNENCPTTHCFLKYDIQCHVCGRSDGPPLVECGYCPKVFHVQCLPSNSFGISPALRRICPYHRCIICGSAQFLYRCVLCVNSFCPSHKPRVVEYVNKVIKEVDERDPYRCNFIFCPCKFSRHIPYLSFKLRHQERVFVCERKHSYSFHEENDESQKNIQQTENALSKDHQFRHGADPLVAENVVSCSEQDITKPDPTLVAYLRQFMTESNLLQKDLAEELRVSASTVSKYLNGKKKVNGWRTFELKLMTWIFQQNRRIANTSRRLDSYQPPLSSSFLSSSTFVESMEVPKNAVATKIPVASNNVVAATTTSQEPLSDGKFECNQKVLTSCHFTLAIPQLHDTNAGDDDNTTPLSSRYNFTFYNPTLSPIPSPNSEFPSLETEFEPLPFWTSVAPFEAADRDDIQISRDEPFVA